MRPIQTEFAAINITLHPSSPDGTAYVRLFRSLFALQKSVRVHGASCAMIGSMNELATGKPEEGLEGNIFRYVQIDPNADWLDTRNLKVVSSDDAKKEISFPDHYKPNLEKIRYVFYPQKHRLIFTSRSPKGDFSPNLAEKMLNGLICDSSIREKFPSIEIIVEQNADTLDLIYNEMRIKHFKIVIKRPNPDGPDGDDATIETILDDQGAREQRIELRREAGTFLNPNATNKRLARLATSNGYVLAEGIDSLGRKIKRNTKDHPFFESHAYPPDINFRNWFLLYAKRVLDKILKK